MLWKKKGQRKKSHRTWTKPRSGRLHKYYYLESLTLWLKWQGVTPIHTQLKWGLFRREITLDEALFLSQCRPCKYWQFKGPQVGNMCSHKGGSGDLWVGDGHVIPCIQDMIKAFNLEGVLRWWNTSDWKGKSQRPLLWSGDTFWSLPMGLTTSHKEPDGFHIMLPLWAKMVSIAKQHREALGCHGWLQWLLPFLSFHFINTNQIFFLVTHLVYFKTKYRLN